MLNHFYIASDITVLRKAPRRLSDKCDESKLRHKHQVIPAKGQGHAKVFFYFSVFHVLWKINIPLRHVILYIELHSSSTACTWHSLKLLDAWREFKITTDSAKKSELETSKQIYFIQFKAVDLFLSGFFLAARVSSLGWQQIGPIEASHSDQAIASELIAAMKLANIWETGLKKSVWLTSLKKDSGYNQDQG